MVCKGGKTVRVVFIRLPGFLFKILKRFNR